MEHLFHFCPAHMAPSILTHGLTRGFVLLSDNPIQMNPDYRWLTTNPEWAQEWAEGTGRLPYKRNEVRLTVEIPDMHTNRILRWTVSGPLITPCYAVLSSFGDPDNWRLFRGDILPQWIVCQDVNPAYK